MLLTWFKSYLSNRTQVTRIGNSTSSEASITSGVIQGSVLGPILFLIYINNVLKVIKYGTVFIFADDIKIVYTCDRSAFRNFVPHIQQDLDALSNWSSLSQLDFSIEKCQVLPFRIAPEAVSLVLCGKQIPVVPSVRDLGIRYSCNFNFSSQAQYQLARAKRTSFFILRSFHLLKTKLILYKQRVRPTLEFCSFADSFLSKADRLAIENIQRRFTRCLLPITNASSYRARCTQLRLEPLWMRRLKLNLAFLHKILHNSTHVASGCPTFILNSPYNLRNSEFTLNIQPSRTSFHSRSFFVLYPSVWNRLPVELRSMSDQIYRYILGKCEHMPGHDHMSSNKNGL